MSCGPQAPTNLRYTVDFEYNNTVFAVGTGTTELYRFDLPSMTWVDSGLRLGAERVYTQGTLVPDSLLECA